MDNVVQTNHTNSIFIQAKDTAINHEHLVIFLHGWAQNAHVFRNRTKTLTRRFLQQGIDCLFLNAPMHLPPLTNVDSTSTKTKTRAVSSLPSQLCSNHSGGGGGRQDARAWFYYNTKDPTDRSHSQTGETLHYVGLEKSLELLQSELKQIPSTVHVSLLGFSQGAVLVHIVAALKERNTAAIKTRINDNNDSSVSVLLTSCCSSSASACCCWDRIHSCILIGGFPATPSNWMLQQSCCCDDEQAPPPRQLQLLQLNNISKLSSLHIVGIHDTSVPPTLSYDLAACFLNRKKVLFEHSGGHVVPQQAEVCKKMVTFILETRKLAFVVGGNRNDINDTFMLKLVVTIARLGVVAVVRPVARCCVGHRGTRHRY